MHYHTNKPFNLTICYRSVSGKDASECRRHRVWQRGRPGAVEHRGRLGVGPAAHPGGRTGAHPAVAAPLQGGAEAGSRGSGLEEGAVLPGAVVLAGLVSHARHRHRHYNHEPTTGCNAAEVVAEVPVLPGGARADPGEAGRGVMGHQWWGNANLEE